MVSASVIGKQYRFAKCDAKYLFFESKSTLYRKIVRISFVNMKTNVTQSAIDTDEADKKGNIASPLRQPFQCPVGLYCLLSVLNWVTFYTLHEVDFQVNNVEHLAHGLASHSVTVTTFCSFIFLCHNLSMFSSIISITTALWFFKI